MKPLLTILITALAAATVAPAPAQAARDGHYRIIDLGTLGGHFSQALAINNRGQVVGYSATPDGLNHAFLYSAGVMTDLGVPGPVGTSVATDVNDAGQVVGEAYSQFGLPAHAFLWDGGVMTDLGTLPGGRYSTAIAVNNRGQVLGYSETGSGRWHVFLWEDGVMTDLGEATGTDINDRGQAVGTRGFATGHHGFLWEDGLFTELTDLYPVAVNNRGWVAGHGPSLTGYLQAHVWRSGELTRLGWPAGYSEVRGINDRGQIVGLGNEVLFGQLHPFLWQDGTIVDLTTRGLAPDADVADINRRGQIAGTVVIEAGNSWHAAIFVP